MRRFVVKDISYVPAYKKVAHCTSDLIISSRLPVLVRPPSISRTKTVSASRFHPIAPGMFDNIGINLSLAASASIASTVSS